MFLAFRNISAERATQLHLAQNHWNRDAWNGFSPNSVYCGIVDLLPLEPYSDKRFDVVVNLEIDVTANPWWKGDESVERCNHLPTDDLDSVYAKVIDFGSVFGERPLQMTWIEDEVM